MGDREAIDMTDADIVGEVKIDVVGVLMAGDSDVVIVVDVPAGVADVKCCEVVKLPNFLLVWFCDEWAFGKGLPLEFFSSVQDELRYHSCGLIVCGVVLQQRHCR